MNGRQITYTIAVLAAVPLLYCTSYFLLVRQGMGEGGEQGFSMNETYLFRPVQFEALYAPIHRLDRNVLRPSYWWQENEEPLRLELETGP